MQVHKTYEQDRRQRGRAGASTLPRASLVSMLPPPYPRATSQPWRGERVADFRVIMVVKPYQHWKRKS